MKNDSKLSMACGGVSMELTWGYLWFLSPPGPGLPGK